MGWKDINGLKMEKINEPTKEPKRALLLAILLRTLVGHSAS
jgi:hypothetical protein